MRFSAWLGTRREWQQGGPVVSSFTRLTLTQQAPCPPEPSHRPRVLTRHPEHPQPVTEFIKQEELGVFVPSASFFQSLPPWLNTLPHRPGHKASPAAPPWGHVPDAGGARKDTYGSQNSPWTFLLDRSTPQHSLCGSCGQNQVCTSCRWPCLCSPPHVPLPIRQKSPN